LANKAIEFDEKSKKGLLRRRRSFKVIDVGINRKLATNRQNFTEIYLA